MKLAEAIHRALTEPGFRLVLETGTTGTKRLSLHPQELEALSEAVRSLTGTASKKRLDDVYAQGIVPDWREE